MTGRLKGRTALITGAANGCGREAVKLFLAEGACVVGADIDAEAGRTLAEEVGTDAFLFVEADVSKIGDVRETMRQANERFGTVDILHSQAGDIIVKPLLDFSEADWEFLFDRNARSVFLTTQAVLPGMLQQGRGVIVNTASVSAFTASPMEAVYCASKAAVTQFTRAVAVEFRDSGIRANSISPGFVRTKHGEREIAQLRKLGVRASPEDIRAMQGRICEPIEVARTALFLASDESSFINGADVSVDNTFAAI